MFGNIKVEDDNYEDDSKVKMDGWGLGGGFAFFLNQNIALNIGLGYVEISGEGDDNREISQEISMKGTTLSVGFSFCF